MWARIQLEGPCNKAPLVTVAFIPLKSTTLLYHTTHMLRNLRIHLQPTTYIQHRLVTLSQLMYPEHIPTVVSGFHLGVLHLNILVWIRHIFYLKDQINLWRVVDEVITKDGDGSDVLDAQLSLMLEKQMSERDAQW
jgi:hypothetical protein